MTNKQTSNLVGSPILRRVEQPARPEEFERFEKLTRQLVAAPKTKPNEKVS